jgi:hypothetical protein
MKTSSFVYVAMDNDCVPIATSNDREELFKAVDYHVGAHEKFKHESTRVDWEPYNPKYPSDYEGRLLYDCPTYTDEGREVIAIRIYSVEYFTKQEDDTTTVDSEISTDL